MFIHGIHTFTCFKTSQWGKKNKLAVVLTVPTVQLTVEKLPGPFDCKSLR